MAESVRMPQLGESVVEGTIVEWKVKEGDAVTKDQLLVTISTDKANTDVPAPVSGVVVKLLAAVNATIPVNAEIALIDTAAAGASAPAAAPVASAPAASGGAAPSSPAVRKAAAEHGVDLQQLRGSGEHGRITKQDVLAAAQGPAPAAAPAPQPAVAPSAPAPAVATPASSASVALASVAVQGAAPGAFRVPPYRQEPGDEIVPFSRRRRIIADHMVYSKHVSPHVMTFAEIDLQKTHKLREANKGALKAQGVNLTFLSFIAHATARALRENPAVNSRVLDNSYVKLKHINLGIAVETKEGLVVPVIRNADELTVRGLARAIDDTAEKARTGKVTADELSGGTFTISNPGLKGNFVGAAIISQPNVGILRVGEIVKRPVVVEVDGQDMIAIHPVMFACLSYDHRIVDGVAANNFLHRITELLEAGQFEL